MTKQERRALNIALCCMATASDTNRNEIAGYAARSISALIRATATTKNRTEMLTAAAAFPAIVQHADFIV